MRGRKPKPDEVKRLAGNPGKRKLAPPEVLPPAEEAAPEHLIGIAKDKWDELAPALCLRGVLKKTDRDALEAYCEAYATWRNARAEMFDDEGKPVSLTVETPNGALQQHPIISVIKQAQDSMRAWASELGLTPSSRGRVTGDGDGEGKGGEEDPFFSPKRKEPPKRGKNNGAQKAPSEPAFDPGYSAAAAPAGSIH